MFQKDVGIEIAHAVATSRYHKIDSWLIRNWMVKLMADSDKT